MLQASALLSVALVDIEIFCVLCFPFKRNAKAETMKQAKQRKKTKAKKKKLISLT